MADDDVATEAVWSEPDEMGVRTLLAAEGDKIPAEAKAKAKAKTTAKNKAAAAEEEKETA